MCVAAHCGGDTFYCFQIKVRISIFSLRLSVSHLPHDHSFEFSIIQKAMDVYYLILGVLGVWRIAHLFNAEDGPWDLLYRLRRTAGNGFPGTLLDCFYCLSLWVAVPFALWIGGTWSERILLWPALSAGAIIIERSTVKKEIVPVQYMEDKEE